MKESILPDLPPISPGDRVVHVIGGGFNVALVLLAGYRLVQAGWVAPWYVTVLSVLLGLYVGDFVSGFLHWGFDTWFDTNPAWMMRMVVMVREHHLYPIRILRYGFFRDFGVLSWFGFVMGLPWAVPVAASSGPLTVGGHARLVSWAVASSIIVVMLECHKAAHRPRRSHLVRFLQATHFLLSNRRHQRHHRGAHDTHFCIVNGWVDETLGRLGMWRLFERIISAMTGAVPRQNDTEWRERLEVPSGVSGVSGVSGKRRGER